MATLSIDARPHHLHIIKATFLWPMVVVLDMFDCTRTVIISISTLVMPRLIQYPECGLIY